MSEKARAEGTFAAPPPEAPREVAIGGLDAETVAAQLAQAQAHERTLQPLTFAPSAPTTTPSTPPAETPPAGRALRRVSRPSVAPVAVETVEAMTADESSVPVVEPLADPAAAQGSRSLGASSTPDGEAGGPSTVRPPTAPPPVAAPAPPAEPYQPAASNTDSPSRGVPRAIDDPGKTITGGFGDAFAAQYFPLDGTELRELILAEMDALAARLANDLRFSIAATYPRVTARVRIEVEAYAQDQNFVIERVAAHDKTPIEVARACAGAQHVVFVLAEQAREMTDEGESESPPNQLRQELGLPVPRKQRVETPTGGMLVDQVAAITPSV